MKIFVLPHKSQILAEIRPAYFLRAFNMEPLDMRIISFGKCNFSCPYCKRGGNTKDADMIEGAVEIPKEKLYTAIDDAIMKKQVIRLSGGDPVCYPKLSLEILKYAKSKGAVTSIAHNGSGTAFVKSLINYLDFASIDFKASCFEDLAQVANLDLEFAKKAFANNIETIKLLTHSGVKTDVRTCIFEKTTMAELDKIAEILEKNSNKEFLFWTLRTYSPIENCSSKAKSLEEMHNIALSLSKKHKGLLIGLRAKWEPGGFAYFKNGMKIEYDVNCEDVLKAVI